MNNLLIVNLSQFGYHIDTYYYCKYLKNEYNITYICWDYKLPRVSISNVKVVYIERVGNKIYRYIRMLLRIRKFIKINNYDIIFIKYFRLCSFLIKYNSRDMVNLDIRTGGVSKNKINRILYNILIKIEQKYFNHITIISDGLMSSLKISKKKCYIVHLGADKLSNTNKKFDTLKLLYIGTLTNRKIHITIEGIALFLQKNDVKLKYDIIGFGDEISTNKIENEIERHNLNDSIILHGRVPHNQLKQYLDKSNIGVSFVPIKSYFQFQPPTKTYEYLLSGLFVIATNTYENQKIINDLNGILINDTKYSYADALYYIFENRKKYSSKIIRETCKNYTWEKIVMNSLNEHLKNVLYNLNKVN